MFNKNSLLLYAVTDRSWLKSGETLADAVKKALEGGVTLVQLREKNISTENFIKSAIEIKAICKQYNVPLIINDNVDVCLAADADGVHLGQGDMPVREARKLLGSSKIIGITAKTPEQAIEAQNSGADYLGSGAVFGTSTKSDAKKMSIETLKSITEAVSIPVVAIGGINSLNIEQLAGSGISGAAVVSGIFAADDITAEAKKIKEKIGSLV